MRPRGFTLIEILIALMVIAIGLAAIMGVFIHGVRSSHDVVNRSAAALTARAVLVRVLTEQVAGADDEEGLSRVFLKKIVDARGKGLPFVWVHAEPHFTDEKVPNPVRVAPGSPYLWRCRASSYRADPGNPMQDMVRKDSVRGDKVRLVDGRISDKDQLDNPDSNELWRIAIEVFRGDDERFEPIGTFQTYICTAHM